MHRTSQGIFWALALFSNYLPIDRVSAFVPQQPQHQPLHHGVNNQQQRRRQYATFSPIILKSSNSAQEQGLLPPTTMADPQITQQRLAAIARLQQQATATTTTSNTVNPGGQGQGITQQQVAAIQRLTRLAEETVHKQLEEYQRINELIQATLALPPGSQSIEEFDAMQAAMQATMQAALVSTQQAQAQVAAIAATDQEPVPVPVVEDYQQQRIMQQKDDMPVEEDLPIPPTQSSPPVEEEQPYYEPTEAELLFSNALDKIGTPAEQTEAEAATAAANSVSTDSLVGVAFQLEEMEDIDACTSELVLNADFTITLGETDGPIYQEATGTWSSVDDGSAMCMTLTRKYNAGHEAVALTDLGEFHFAVERSYVGLLTTVGERLAISGTIHIQDDLFSSDGEDPEVGFFNMIDTRPDDNEEEDMFGNTISGGTKWKNQRSVRLSA